MTATSDRFHQAATRMGARASLSLGAAFARARRPMQPAILSALAALVTLASLFTAQFQPAGAAEVQPQRTPSRIVTTGAEILAKAGFKILEGKRVGLVTNQTALVDGRHLADWLHEAPNVELAAILAPEHGFRGAVEAGEKVNDEVDPATGVPVFSLYGRTRKPTRAMLKGIDVLVFDIQDIGARFYTYISTMGLAMQAAAESGVPFVVLDRPNPLGGDYVSGFVLEPARKSFVGQYPIPIVHGLTVGELAQMIKGERWLPGLEKLDLSVVAMDGWKRSMRWPVTGLPWTPTSPNIPTFKSALVYPGIGIVGETQVVNEGRGTAEPFTVFGAPWIDAERLAGRLNALNLPGVHFEAETYRPRSIPGVALSPKYVGKRINGVRVVVTDIAQFQPLETGVHALAEVLAEARRKGAPRRFKNLAMFHLIAGTKSFYRMLMDGQPGERIVAAWKSEAARFEAQAQAYHIY